MNFSVITCLCAALVAPSALALAQSARPDPADAKLVVPPTVYVSPFAQYRPFADEQVIPWTGANEAVEKAGGWKAYAREAQEPAKPGGANAVPPKPAPSTNTTPSVHMGHPGHVQPESRR